MKADGRVKTKDELVTEVGGDPKLVGQCDACNIFPEVGETLKTYKGVF